MKPYTHLTIASALFTACLVLTSSGLAFPIVHINEQFTGPGYEIGQTPPNGGTSPNVHPWIYFVGTTPPPPANPVVVTMPQDSNNNSPSGSRAWHLVRPTGSGSWSTVYRTQFTPAPGGSLILEAGGRYEWSFDYKFTSGQNIIFLDTGSGTSFAGLQISPTALNYLTAGTSGSGTYTSAGAENVLSQDVWYHIHFDIEIASGDSTNQSNYTLTVTALGSDDPAFTTTVLLDTNANFTTAARLGISPQPGVDGHIANIYLASIPEVETISLLAGISIIGLLVYQRRQRKDQVVF